MIKASDLNSVFGHVSQKSPLYFHINNKRNQRITGNKSDKLKYKLPLCARCNNQRTQPHDMAWEKLSTYLRKRQPPLRPGDSIRLGRVFPGRVRQSMLDIHLFFVKHFGCLIVEHSIPIDIEVFSKSILNGVAHRKVWLSFSIDLNSLPRKHVGGSEVKVARLNGRIAYATWLYVVGNVIVNVIYAEPGECRKGLLHAWHPANVSKRMKLLGL